MNCEYLDYKSAKRLATKSILVLISVQMLVSVIFVIYFYCTLKKLPENIYIHHHLSYKQAVSAYGNMASNVDQNLLVFKKTELLNKFVYNTLLASTGSFICWYLIFKIIGTKADWARPRLDKEIVQLYRLCWYCRLQYSMFILVLIKMFQYFEVVRTGLGVFKPDVTIIWSSGLTIVLVIISIIIHTVVWKKMNIPIFW